MDGYPWEGEDEDEVVQFQIVLTEKEHAKLKYIGENVRGVSMHSFVLDNILPAIDESIEKMTGKKS